MSDRFEEMVMNRTDSGRFLKKREARNKTRDIIIKTLGILTAAGWGLYFLSRLPIILGQ